MIHYHLEVQEDDLICSIDRIRIDFKFAYSSEVEVTSEFLQWMAHNGEMCLFNFESWVDYRMFHVKHLFSISLPNRSSFKLGIGYNGDKERMRCGFIEFNPNKIFYDEAGGFRSINDKNVYLCSIEIVEMIFKRLYGDCCSWKIRDFDIAIDLPYQRDKFTLHKDLRDYRLFKISDLNYTEYLGKRSSVGAVKVYNKQVESNLEYPLTRIEMTSSLMDYKTFFDKFPKIYLQDDLDLSELRDTDLVICQLFSRLSNIEKDKYFRKLGRVKQKKLKDFIFREDRCVMISEKTYYQLLDNVVKYHSPSYVNDDSKDIYSEIDKVLASEQTSAPSANEVEPKNKLEEFLGKQMDFSDF